MSLDPARMIPMANAIRALSMDAVQKAQSGHPGMPMGMADVATVLWSNYLKYDASAPDWADRDRFVLSAGHGSMLLYSLLHLSGFAHPTMEEIENFRQVGSPTAGHPENFLMPGIEATTGPLGQGLAMAVGMAMAERHLNAQFGNDLVDHNTWVIAGDGCLMEGINHEAIGLAGHLKLGKLICLWDDNRITIDGSTDLSTSENVRARFEATGWFVNSCDGHDYADIARAIEEAQADERPALIACRTIIGYGAPNKQGTSSAHGSPLGASEIETARKELNWQAAPFEIPDQIRSEWHSAGMRGADVRTEWGARLDDSEHKAEFERRMAGDLPEGFDLSEFVGELVREPQKVATRKASENALAVINGRVPETVGGSADLTGSNNTLTDGMGTFSADDRSGRYVYYGIREFGMSAAMNGMALHGGVIPYGGTFLVFSDYCRPAIRLSALQQVRVIYVMTHDSIGLGEDGPTHQPIEHLQSLRAIPNLLVMRPGDAVETAECWELALQQKKRPTVLALSRQGLTQYRTEAADENRSAKGAYRVKESAAERRVILIATGSEVGLALDVAAHLEERDIGADVVSMPCAELFDEQSPAYRDKILPNAAPDEILRVSIEAGTTFGWDRYTMSNGLRIGIDSFGTSAPGTDAYEHFGLTSEAIVPRIIAKLEA
ncbi:MAG: transketolase [Erythrobacter sp.]|nr:transketolase [Erythrobacter sp.]NCQ63690.1 transketolase [Alphaproteobacteria bacterium]